MRSRAAWTITIAGLLALIAPAVAHAQAFELNGGYSTMFQAQGGSLAVQAGDSQGWIGGGIVQHRFKLGAYGQTLLRRFTIGAGDDATEFRLPTDLFTGGEYVFRRGLSLGYQRGATTVSLFGGTSSQAFGAPYFRAAEADTPLGMLAIDYALTPALHVFTRNLFSGTQTSISGAEWQALPWLKMAVAAGVGGNQPYASSNLVAKWDRLEIKTALARAGERFRRVVVPAPQTSEVDGPNLEVNYRPAGSLELSAGHLELLQPGDSQLQSVRAKVNRATVGLALRGFRFGGGAFQTKVGTASGTAQNLYVNRTIFRRVEATANSYRSQAGPATMQTQSLTLRENLHPRLKLLQMISHSNGQLSLSYGGEFISNPVRLSLDYQNIYVPFDMVKPLRQAVSVNAEFRLVHGLGVRVASFVDSTGTTRYTLSGKQFLYHGPGRRSEMPVARGKFGKYVVRGHVIDQSGRAVAGAAVYIDGQLALTDSDGRFFVRFKTSAPQPVRLATDEFLQPGYWQVVKAPLTVSPQFEDEAQEIEIVVRQLPPQAKRLRDTKPGNAAAPGRSGPER